ncbi:DNA-binding transcriptional regulator, LysR family [Paenibacillus uliginis N3/975]|uniref:DNA-binding transcriptional regulator, LysR family n=1 Tax=Paenibacillus uliginis N3/975 TaxID=1313296 RepID=A0A1X7HHH4_9BACL|nr:LysR family transcriptional regulator [Paenibacillus uliginis]SMF86742.1 DNA-binding transcriptional regulator, LysR family [Paenibacillus uliginis N3/975]
MNLHALRLFYYVALTGSVTKASEKLHISQPAISAQIRKFEKENNIKLFNIQGRGLILTPLGKKLIKPLEKIFAIEEQVHNLIEDYHHYPEGKLRIAGNYLATSVLIPKWASLYKQKYSAVEVQITTVNSHEAIEKLLNFEVDVAIYSDMGVPFADPDVFESTELYRDEYLFVVAPGHKYALQQVTFKEIASEPFIMREVGSAARERLLQLCREQQINPPQIELQFNGLHETILAVMAGYGVSFVSSLVAEPLLMQGVLARVDVPGISSSNSIMLGTRSKEHQEMFVHDFISLVIHHLDTKVL